MKIIVRIILLTALLLSGCQTDKRVRIKTKLWPMDMEPAKYEQVRMQVIHHLRSQYVLDNFEKRGN